MIASKFGIGQQVRHSLLGYLGVVVSCLHSYFLNPGRSRNFVNNIRFCHFL